MNVIHPRDFRAIAALDAQKRRRLPNGRVIEDGEVLSFNIALVRDAASAGTASAYLTDTASITRRADFTRALASARFSDSAKLIDLPEGSTRAIGGTASANAPTHDAGPARATVNALRLARYS